MTSSAIPDTIWMVTETDSDDEPQGSRNSQDIGGDWNDNQPREFQATRRGKTAVKVETLREEMGKLIRVVRHVFGEAEQQVGIELTEITLSVEVSGEGSVSILGSGGKAAAKGAINLKFNRIKP